MRPNRDHLYRTAEAQVGLFSTKQAAEAGYSPQLLAHHQHGGIAKRVRRGIYRLTHFPPGEHEELVVAWLWSMQQGIVSHQTALALYELSDIMPSTIHLTLPADWKRRRFRIPTGVLLHFDNVPNEDRKWFGPVPITSVRRTLNDCALAGLSPEFLRQAAKQALHRGVVITSDLGAVEEVLRPYGGIAS